MDYPKIIINDDGLIEAYNCTLGEETIDFRHADGFQQATLSPGQAWSYKLYAHVLVHIDCNEEGHVSIGVFKKEVYWWGNQHLVGTVSVVVVPGEQPEESPVVVWHHIEDSFSTCLATM